MTEHESQHIDCAGKEPIFGRSGLRDAWDAVKYNLLNFVFSTFIVFCVLELNKTRAFGSILGVVRDDMNLSHFFLIALHCFVFGVLICSALSFLVYAVHSTAMIGVSGVEAFANERRREVGKYVVRFTFVASLSASVFALLFVWLLYILASGMRGNGNAFVLGLWLWPTAMILALVIANLVSTWPVSVFFTGQSSWRRAWERGRRSFGYVASRNILLLPLTCWIWVATGVSLIDGAAEPAVQSGTLHGLVDVKATLLTSLFASVWSVLQAVIVSRAFTIGEARLSSSV